VTRSIVVALRMPPAGMSPGPEGSYLTRARALCIRGETFGGRLVAWSEALLAMGWDTDEIEKAVLFAAGIREEALSPERAWASGIAEGELEALSPDGQGILAWGPALLSAASLAHLASAGDVLVDDEVLTVHDGKLSLLGDGVATDPGETARGRRLDLQYPWKGASTEGGGPMSDEPLAQIGGTGSPLLGQGRNDPLVTRIRKLAGSSQSAPAVDALAELRRARARVEKGPPSARCQAALALAMMLSIAARPEDALLETLDALARAREADDPKAIGACMALLAKLYAGAGLSDAATALRDGITVG
jgi:hypothetical protein